MVIRSDDGAAIVSGMFDMLKIFLTFKSQKYTCSLTYALLLLDHWLRTQPLLKLLWCKYARVFYEESGEVALSHLSRTNYRSTRKQDINIACEAFVMRHEDSKGAAFWEEETDGTFVRLKKSGAVRIDPSGEECSAAAAWLKTTIRNLTQPGLQKMYTRPPGTDPSWFNAYKCKLDAERKQQPMIPTRQWFIPDSKTELALRMDRAKQNLYKSDVLEVEKLVSLWPGGQQRFDSFVAAGEATASATRRIKAARAATSLVLNPGDAEEDVVDDMNLLQRYAEDSDRDSDLTGQEESDYENQDQPGTLPLQPQSPVGTPDSARPQSQKTKSRPHKSQVQ